MKGKMKLRIIWNNGTFRIQRKFLFWWVNMTEGYADQIYETNKLDIAIDAVERELEKLKPIEWLLIKTYGYKK